MRSLLDNATNMAMSSI